MAATTEQAELEDIRKSIGQLREELAELFKYTRNYSRGKIMESSERIKKALNNLKNQISEKASAACEATKDFGNNIAKKSRQTVSQRPIASVAVAFLAGVILAKLIRRRQA